MMSSDFLQELTSLVHTKRGRPGLISRCANPAWWQTPDRQHILTLLITHTASLPTDATIPERIYWATHNIQTPPLCHCGQPLAFKSYSEGYHTYCSRACSYVSDERNQKIREHRDMTSIIAKCQQTNMERYGVPWTTQHSGMIDKTQRTKYERYGDTHYNNHAQAKQTCLERYGVPSTNLIPAVQQKMRDTRRDNHPQLRDAAWLSQANQTQSLTDIAVMLGVTRKTVDDWMVRHQLTPIIHTKKRRLEPIIAEQLRTLGIPFHQNIRTIIPPKELDFYWDQQKVAVEINGCYWHANDHQRHLEKHQSCASQGIRLLQFWDYEWLQHPNICLSIVAQALGMTATRIHGRSCRVVNVTNTEYRAFLEQHHLMGPAGATWKRGLVYHGKLVAVMGISKHRFRRSNEYELVRFACRQGVHIHGGFSKLLQAWNQPLWSYTDRRLFSGYSYHKTGFTHHHDTTPGYFYYRRGERKTRLECQKHKLSTWLPNFDDTLSEAANMGAQGWSKVYDCGQSVWYKP